jgi:hypothetical protein
MSNEENKVVRLPDNEVPKEDFNVFERLFLLNGVLPQHGSFTTVKIVSRLKEELSFSESEHDRYEINNTPDGRLSLTKDDSLLKETKSIPLGKRARQVIIDGLKELDRKKALTAGHIILYERFVGGEEDGVE